MNRIQSALILNGAVICCSLVGAGFCTQRLLPVSASGARHSQDTSTEFKTWKIISSHTLGFSGVENDSLTN